MDLRYTTIFEIIMYCILVISIVLFTIGAIADIAVMIDIPAIIIGNKETFKKLIGYTIETKLPISYEFK